MTSTARRYQTYAQPSNQFDTAGHECDHGLKVMTPVDGGIVCILGIFAVAGYLKGLFRQVAGIVALAIAVLLSSYSGSLVMAWATDGYVEPNGLFFLSRVVSGALLYFLLMIIVWYVDSRIKEGRGKKKSLNSRVGAFIGILKGGVIVSIILIGVNLIPAKTLGALPWVEDSWFLNQIRRYTPSGGQYGILNIRALFESEAPHRKVTKPPIINEREI